MQVKPWPKVWSYYGFIYIVLFTAYTDCPPPQKKKIACNPTFSINSFINFELIWYALEGL